MQNKESHFFLDETGDHGLGFVDESFPIFLVAGCLFESAEYGKITQEMYAFKQEFFNTTEVVLHSRDIRKCDGVFQTLFDLELKKKFYERLNAIISGANFVVIAVAIDKKKHIEKYGKLASNPYTICLSYMLERLIFCMDDKHDISTVSITIEKRGKREDKERYSRNAKSPFRDLLPTGDTPIHYLQHIPSGRQSQYTKVWITLD